MHARIQSLVYIRDVNESRILTKLQVSVQIAAQHFSILYGRVDTGASGREAVKCFKMKGVWMGLTRRTYMNYNKPSQALREGGQGSTAWITVIKGEVMLRAEE